MTFDYIEVHTIPKLFPRLIYTYYAHTNANTRYVIHIFTLDNEKHEKYFNLMFKVEYTAKSFFLIIHDIIEVISLKIRDHFHRLFSFKIRQLIYYVQN